MNAAVDYVNSEGAQNIEVLQEDIEHLVREKDLLQELFNKMEYTINLQNVVIASLNDESLESNNSAASVRNNFDKCVMSALSALTLSYTKYSKTETGSRTKNPADNITKMDSTSATRNPDILKPRAGNIIQPEDVKNAIALAENSLGKDTNKPPILKKGYQVVDEGDLCPKAILSPLKNTGLFEMMQFNTQCIMNKLNFIEIFLQPLTPSVICVAEHWWNPSSLPSAIIPGYTQAAAFCRTISIPAGELIF
ncbi:hypothetical protein WA026_001352 [Henosepilachna vigintioctopunctata]|uniref:Uncharacterized protein n=1 Tax=Henosepilachna vigintioctopunctata TaxID=420089 RepID=A0AAW1UQ46_9CUCU